MTIEQFAEKHNDCLKQLLTVTWDGNIISKPIRDRFVDEGYTQRAYGWNWITQKGLKFLLDEKYLAP